MSRKPVLLFLHGVGSGDQGDQWKDALDSSLQTLGYPDLSGVTVIAPKYPNTLKGSDDYEPLPKLTVKGPGGDTAKKIRRDFERRMGAVEVMLGRHDRGSGWFGADGVIHAAFGLGPFQQANNYVTDGQIRAQVLHRVLKVLPKSGRLVIIGHSLGSVIAADLVRRLPVDLEVAGMVTLGSPLANARFHVDKLQATLTSPPANLAWWVNFWNDADPVTTHKGVSSVFPWMADYRVRTPLGLDVHDAVTYLSNEVATAAIGFALFGSRSKALATVDKGVDIPLDYAETVGVMALRYAHLTLAHLEDDRQERFAAALRQVQSSTVDLVKQRNTSVGRPLPSAIAELALDLTDPDSVPPKPASISALSKEQAIVPLLSIAAANVIRPFEIEVSKEIRRSAMEQLTLEMGLGSQIGVEVFRAADRARDELKGGTNWIKWAAVGLGAAALVAATGGLALAAAPGVAGAAAITSALAAFGPGGMIGGLLTAGTLVSAGGGGIAIGLASSGTTAATVEAVVTSQLAVAILRQSQGIEQDPATWSGLVTIGIELRRERSRLEAFSDESAPTLKELRMKLDAVDRALAYLQSRDLGPAEHAEAQLD